jgi:hypothetical protein
MDVFSTDLYYNILVHTFIYLVNTEMLKLGWSRKWIFFTYA